MKPISRISLLFAGLITLTQAAQKNVLFIAVDDLKPTIGAYGNPSAKTPNIDKIASRGLLFESAYTSQALCSPSRNALLTGIRPTTLGIYGLDTHFRLAAPDAITLPQQFLKNGYRSEAVGKLFHVGQGNKDDEKSGSVPLVRPPAPTYSLKENQAPPGEKPTGRQQQQQQRGVAYESADVSDDTYADGKIADEIIGRLEAAKGRPETPFFIGAGFLRPHLPFVSPKKYWDLYDPATLKLPGFRTAPAGAPAASVRNNGELSSYKGIPENGVVDEATQLKLLHGFYAAVSYTDAQIGKVLDALDRLGLTENTIIVLWGDHGWHLGDHGLWGKMTNLEQATRIPLIISAPGVTQPGSRTKSLVESIDIYPTLLDLAGLPKPDSTPKLEGTSLLPVLKDPAVSVNEQVLQAIPRQGLIGRAIRTSTHRLVEWKKPGASDDTAEIELYDYTTDPEEKKNLATDQPETTAKLRAKLSAYPQPKFPFVAARITETPAPARNREMLFNTKDTNKDGQLSREEFLANQSNAEQAAKRLTRFDKNSDGILTREEFVSAGN